MTPSTGLPTALKAPLPDALAWLESDVQALVRPTAFIKRPPTSKGVALSIAPMGSTRAWGSPDIPIDAPWAPSERLAYLHDQWRSSPYDGESFWLQLNLAEIPADVAMHLPKGCPRIGVVWVFINLHGDWTGTARFDPRDASTIAWQPRPSTNTPQEPVPAQWVADTTVPCSTPKTLPAIASNWDSMAERYDDWVQDQYRGQSDVQIGGWVWPIQGDFDDRQETFVCALERQSFGDSGAVYLHFSAAEGFFVHVETC